MTLHNVGVRGQYVMCYYLGNTVTSHYQTVPKVSPDRDFEEPVQPVDSTTPYTSRVQWPYSCQLVFQVSRSW